MFVKGMQSFDRFVIKIDEDNNKLKDILIDELGFSTRSISKMKREKNIFVNGKVVKPSIEVRRGDLVEIEVSEEGSNFLPQNLDVSVLYEDFDLLLVDKPAFMVVHPSKSHFENTLANFVSFRVKNSEEKYRIRFVNRIDMNTSGIVTVAKNAYAHHSLSIDMGKNKVEKEYIAVVRGRMEKDGGVIDEPIFRPTDDSITRVVDERGQKSVTHYEVIERLYDATVVKIRLETGRTHQIRVHLSHLGHGIIGDELYGFIDENLINRQALHAYKFGFFQPREKNWVEVKSNLPEDILDLIEKLGGNKLKLTEKI